jgi:hypothetical protein
MSLHEVKLYSLITSINQMYTWHEQASEVVGPKGNPCTGIDQPKSIAQQIRISFFLWTEVWNTGYPKKI